MTAMSDRVVDQRQSGYHVCCAFAARMEARTTSPAMAVRDVDGIESVVEKKVRVQDRVEARALSAWG